MCVCRPVQSHNLYPHVSQDGGTVSCNRGLVAMVTKRGAPRSLTNPFVGQDVTLLTGSCQFATLAFPFTFGCHQADGEYIEQVIIIQGNSIKTNLF